jgi:hypothetical protein
MKIASADPGSKHKNEEYGLGVPAKRRRRNQPLSEALIASRTTARAGENERFL